MRLSPKSMLPWIAAFAMAGATLALWPARRTPLPPVETPPWIPLPATGMDASDPVMRQLIVSPYAGALMGRCRGAGDNPDRESYRLLIERNAFEDFREIDIVPRGDWLEIAVRDGFPPAPPEPAREGRRSYEYDLVVPVARVRMQRRDAEPIRRAWDTRALWHAEQQPLGCADGWPITLEACVDGRYAIRHRNCDIEAYRATQSMWEAVTRLLPKPERAHYRAR
jgi:hypothetical protein